MAYSNLIASLTGGPILPQTVGGNTSSTYKPINWSGSTYIPTNQQYTLPPGGGNPPYISNKSSGGGGGGNISSGGGGGGGNTVESILANAISALTGGIKAPEPFEKKNPFYFDEELAKQASIKEYSPYYNEQLSDYVSGIEKTKSRSSEDLQKTVDFLSASKDYFTGAQRRLLDRSLRATNEGFAGRNLFFSGARERDIKEAKAESQATTNEYMTGYNYKLGEANETNKRTLEDANLNESMYTRDINRQKDTAIAQGVLQRKTEALSDYDIQKRKYYSDQGYLT